MRYAAPFAVLMACTLCLFMSPSLSHANEPAKVGVGDLVWLSGCWLAEKENEFAETTWSTPREGAMTGMFRWMRDGKLIVYEFLVVRETDDGLELRMRHFNDDPTGWETKDSPMEYSVPALEDGRVVFVQKSDPGENRVRIEYTRDGDVLNARVTLSEGEQVKNDFTLRFERRAA